MVGVVEQQPRTYVKAVSERIQVHQGPHRLQGKVAVVGDAILNAVLTILESAEPNPQVDRLNDANGHIGA